MTTSILTVLAVLSVPTLLLVLIFRTLMGPWEVQIRERDK